jgi:hypothetical protein
VFWIYDPSLCVEGDLNAFVFPARMLPDVGETGRMDVVQDRIGFHAGE